METIQCFMETNGTLRTAMEFDYESYQTLSIRVKAMDGNNSSVEGAFTVIVTNVNETPTALDHTSSLIVAENEVLGTVVGTFQAQDPDGDALTYHLTSGVGDETIRCLLWRRTALCGLRWSLIMNHTRH